MLPHTENTRRWLVHLHNVSKTYFRCLSNDVYKFVFGTESLLTTELSASQSSRLLNLCLRSNLLRSWSQLLWEPSTLRRVRVRFGSFNLIVRFGLVRLSNLLGSFGSVRNDLRTGFEFRVFGSGSVRFPSLLFDYWRGPRDHSAWAWPAVGTGHWALAVHSSQFTV